MQWTKIVWSFSRIMCTTYKGGTALGLIYVIMVQVTQWVLQCCAFLYFKNLRHNLNSWILSHNTLLLRIIRVINTIIILAHFNSNFVSFWRSCQLFANCIPKRANVMNKTHVKKVGEFAISFTLARAKDICSRKATTTITYQALDTWSQAKSGKYKMEKLINTINQQYSTPFVYFIFSKKSVKERASPPEPLNHFNKSSTFFLTREGGRRRE